jgi:hypothetical protein
MGGQATVRTMESAHHTMSRHGLHTLLHGAWLGSSPAHRHRLRQSTGMSLHRGRQPSCARGRGRRTQRGVGCGTAALRQVPAGPMMLPRAQRAPPQVPRRRPCTPMSSWKQGHAQVITTLGGAIHHSRSTPTWDIQDPVRGWEGRLQHMEHRAPVPVLSLSNCSKLVYQ